MLGVPQALITEHGAVSAPVALAMAEGALKASGAGLAVAITGLAGPGGGSADKPVGLVHFGLARQGRPALHREMRFGDIGREAVRLASVRVALEMLLEGAA
jgi:nicotinamide-nucleotide amidase